MKYFTLLSMLLLSSASLPAQTKNEFTLNGKVIGQDTGFIRLSYIDGNGKQLHDTTRLKNGSFSFSGFIKEPTYASLIANTKSIHFEYNYPDLAEFYLEPGIIKLVLTKNNFEQTRVTGSHTQDEWEILKKEEASGLKAMKLLDKEYSQLRSDTSGSIKNENAKKRLAKQLDSVQDELLAYRKKLENVEYAFVLKHPKSYLSPYLISSDSYDLSLDSLKMFYSKWPPSIRNSFDGRVIKNTIQKMKWTQIGKPAQDFTTKDIKGNNVKLSSFKGKSYVLLDFWASWCVPCRAENPFLKHLYRKYHSKGFDIIGISMDIKKDAWKKAIQNDSIGMWRQVLAAKDLTQPPVPNDIISKFELPYGGYSIPTEILINKEGIIIGIWNGQSKGNENDLENKLKEVLSKNNIQNNVLYQ